MFLFFKQLKKLFIIIKIVQRKRGFFNTLGEYKKIKREKMKLKEPINHPSP